MRVRIPSLAPAIDGPSGVGKSTVAKNLSKKLGFSFLDTGALYRAVALLADNAKIDWKDHTALTELIPNHSFSFDSSGFLFVDGKSVEKDIRTPRMSTGASEVAKHGEVRKSLLNLQRRLGCDGGVVLEGRDIGTVVFPDAEVKFFLNADPAVRAKRRFLEFKERGEKTELDQVMKDLELRDEADCKRAISPLKKALDAVEVRCDYLNAEEVTERMFKYIKSNFPLTSK